MGHRTILVNASYGPSLLGFRGPLLAAMRAAGHEVFVTAPSLDDQTRAFLDGLGVVWREVPLMRTGTNPFADISYARALKQVILHNQIDLVLGYTIKPSIWGSLAAGWAGVESHSLVTGLGYAFADASGVRQQALRAIAVQLWRAATARNKTVIFQNKDDLADFSTVGALSDRAKARLVNGSGVDMAHYRRSALPEGTHFLMIARLLKSKGVREFGEAAIKCKASGMTATFTLAGFHDEGPDGILSEDLKRWESGGLRFIGPQSDVRPAIDACSVYVLPSYREGTPRSVLEAMAFGRPIITTDAPGCRETTRDGINGFLIPPRDVGALVTAMQRLASDAGLRAAFGQASFERCADLFDVEKVNRTMLAHLGLARAEACEAVLAA